MPFLVLTRAGYDDLMARLAPARATLWLNPGVATEAELAQLRDAGANVSLLPAALDAGHAHHLDAAIGSMSGQGEPVWVERGPTDRGPTERGPTERGPTERGPTERGPTDRGPTDRDPPLAARALHDSAAAKVVQDRAHEALHHRLARGAGRFASAALQRLRDDGAGRTLLLVPYFGFGNNSKLWVKGRVLDQRAFREQTSQDSRWRNLLAMYQRLESDEVPGARVRAWFGGQSYDTLTDRGGYFSFDIAPAAAVAGGVHTVALELPDSAVHGGQPVRATADVMVPASSARFAVISDIDDTVLWTNVTNKLNMALMLARSNAHTRKPFKGVAAFYRELNRGAGGDEDNPVFYVSSSPWHLFGPLIDFLRVQGIPVGPLLLRELGIREIFKLTSHGNHKLAKIEQILSYYPGMQFVLIGDSGEQDPEIYAEVVRRHPKAVRAIYIRNVNPDPARIESLDRLIEEVSATGTQLILAPDSVFAATHAAAERLIHVDAVAQVRSDKKQDDVAPPLG